MTTEMLQVIEMVVVGGTAILGAIAILGYLLFRQLIGAMRQQSAELERLATMALVAKVSSTSPAAGAAILQQAKNYPDKLKGITTPVAAPLVSPELEKAVTGVRIRQGATRN